MRTIICEDKIDLGVVAAREGEAKIKLAIEKHGVANIVFVTGNSQLETLKNLVNADIPWDKVNIFHLDEFIGLKSSDPASSVHFLRKYFLSKIGTPLSYTPINGNAKDIAKEVEELNLKMKDYPLDVAFICVGENGHLAFNDPPANFDTKDPYIVVDLDRKSRKQQVSEGWFKTLEDVPEKAITMSINHILSASSIIVSCPDRRKAKAVRSCLFEDINPLNPAGAIRTRQECYLFLDRQSACLVFRDR
jgi:6-phosphogluconolactonase/Glucosamine-6-phosphate isomerase/deaminase